MDQIPKILTLQDRNRMSSTYGCFDRNYWHNRVIDFPSGILQEMCWPLALAYTLEISDNPYHQNPSIREWAIAGIAFAAKSSHRDGSCDDFFPHEKACGAAAFSLLACSESYQLLGLEDPELLDFCRRRADWLASHQESGRLSNHQALVVSCLDSVMRLTGDCRWQDAREARLKRVLEWQDEEGWFQEYDGCDPGYHTFTISLLAGVYEITPTPELRRALEKAVDLAWQFVHPDGSYGGEYGSRNTCAFFPHGFELFGRHMPKALSLNDRILKGIAAGLHSSFTDDHTVGHYPWNALLAWRDFAEQRPSPPERKTGVVRYTNAGIQIHRGENWDLYLATSKGGSFRFFRDGVNVASDTGVTLLMNDRRIAVTHLFDSYEITESDDRITIAGWMGWAKHKKMTPWRMILLRGFMLLAGRLFPDLVRKILQKILITGKNDAPFRFTRTIEVSADGVLEVSDRIEAKSWENVINAAIGTDQTSIYVVMSRVFNPAQMQPWHDLRPALDALENGEPLTVTRQFTP